MDIVETRYNRCFVCGERLVDSKSEQIIRIQKLRTLAIKNTDRPWDFIIDEMLLETRENDDWRSTADGIHIHEECFFLTAGAEWKF